MLVDRMNAGLRRVPEWPLYIVGFVPAAWLLWRAVTGGLGVDPVKVMEHQLGLWGLQLLIATLLVSPLRRYAGVNLLKLRRPLGLLAFGYVFLHLTVWVVLDMGLLWAQMAEDIVKRWYITIGMAAFVILVPLAVTSTRGWIRRLGPRWTQLHRLIYVAAPLGAIHFVLQEKVWTRESLLYLAVVVALVAMRVLWVRRRRVAA